jgi:rSAM/selenodomain-associated transferase 1
MTTRRHLVVFVRAPRIGQVKTRLARDIGAVGAWRFYRRMLYNTLRPLIRDRRWLPWLAVTPESAVFEKRIWPRDCLLINQSEGDLGQRMARVARALPAGPVVIIGADVPGIRPRHIAAAFKALGRHDAVFGPAKDGGYWLVGLKRRPRFLDPFADVRWSTEHALTDTLANLKGADSHMLLETLEDVDDGSAYRRLTPSGLFL